MKPLWVAVYALSLLALPVLVLPAEGFQENVGFSPNHYFESGQFGENVDVTTGNLAITTPIGPTYDINGLSFGVTLTYNAKLWQYVNSNLATETLRQPYLKSNSKFGAGWTYHAGRIYTDDLNLGDPILFNQYNNVEKVRRIVYESPSGSRTTLHAADWVNPENDYYYSQDSSFLRAKSYIVNDSGGNPMTIWKLWHPDGSSRILGLQVGNGRVYQRDAQWGANYNIKPAGTPSASSRYSVKGMPLFPAILTRLILRSLRARE